MLHNYKLDNNFKVVEHLNRIQWYNTEAEEAVCSCLLFSGIQKDTPENFHPVLIRYH